MLLGFCFSSWLPATWRLPCYWVDAQARILGDGSDICVRRHPGTMGLGRPFKPFLRNFIVIPKQTCTALSGELGLKAPRSDVRRFTCVSTESTMNTTQAVGLWWNGRTSTTRRYTSSLAGTGPSRISERPRRVAPQCRQKTGSNHRIDASSNMASKGDSHQILVIQEDCEAGGSTLDT